LIKVFNNLTTNGEIGSVDWNGTDSSGNAVSSGIYLYKMKAGGRYTSTKKMILLK
jgi:flagellar hook assembly protein FlgD